MAVLATRRPGLAAREVLRRGLRAVALAAVLHQEESQATGASGSHTPLVIVFGAVCAFVLRRLLHPPEDPKAALEEERLSEAPPSEEAGPTEGADVSAEPAPEGAEAATASAPASAAEELRAEGARSQAVTRRTFAGVSEADDVPWARRRAPTTHDVADDGVVAEKANSVMAKSLGKNLLDRHRAKKEQEEKDTKQAEVKSALMSALGGGEGPSLKKAVGGATAQVAEMSPWGNARRPSTHTTTKGGVVQEKSDSVLAKKLGKGMIDSFRARKSALPGEAEAGVAATAGAKQGQGDAGQGVDFADDGSGLSDSSGGPEGEECDGEQGTTWDADAVIVRAADVDAGETSPQVVVTSTDVSAAQQFAPAASSPFGSA